MGTVDSQPFVLRGDARALPLADASVDLVVTSPPYFALRSYTDGGEHYRGQIGSEATPQGYIDNLVACIREWMRVLKPPGSIWVNLGDKYGRPGGGADRNPRTLPGAGRGATERMRTPGDGGGREKSLMLLPERFRIACVDRLGLIARAVVIWSKPNGLPESVTDRVRRSHEDWVHLTKQPRYYSAVDEIREPAVRTDRRATAAAYLAGVVPGKVAGHTGLSDRANHALGSLPGSVWEIATEPLKVPDHLGIDHFAAFPTEWPRRIILGWSPSGICVECGEGRRPVVDKPGVFGRNNNPDGAVRSTIYGGSVIWSQRMANPDRIVGEACACREPTAPTRPSVVLDPFGGTGTTALVAKALGRIGISVDMSADYCRLARWRTTDPGELAKAMRVAKPEKPLDGQGDLFDALEAVS